MKCTKQKSRPVCVICTTHETALSGRHFINQSARERAVAHAAHDRDRRAQRRAQSGALATRALARLVGIRNRICTSSHGGGTNSSIRLGSASASTSGSGGGN